MGKSQGKQTVTSTPDPATQERIQQLWQAAQGSAQGGGQAVDPNATAAAGAYGQASNLGLTGMRALSGDQNAIQGLLNPYTQNVVNTTMAANERLKQQGMQGLDSQATLNGAFGGTRADVAKGEYGAGMDAQTAQQIANLQSQGYTNAMSQAGNLANLGMGATAGQAGMGEYFRQAAMENNPLNRLYQNYMGSMQATPSGSTQTQTSTAGRNPFSGALGGILGMAGAGFTGGIPLALGGLLGSFGS